MAAARNKSIATRCESAQRRRRPSKADFLQRCCGVEIPCLPEKKHRRSVARLRSAQATSIAQTRSRSIRGSGRRRLGLAPLTRCGSRTRNALGFRGAGAELWSLDGALLVDAATRASSFCGNTAARAYDCGDHSMSMRSKKVSDQRPDSRRNVEGPPQTTPGNKRAFDARPKPSNAERRDYAARPSFHTDPQTADPLDAVSNEE
jgi:hypothetical protein